MGSDSSGTGSSGGPDAPGAKAGRIGRSQKSLGGGGKGGGFGRTQSREEKKKSFASIDTQAQTIGELKEKTNTTESFFGGLTRNKPAGYVTAEEAEALGPQASLGIQAREVGLDVNVGPEGVSFAPSGFDASRAVGSLLGEEYSVSPSKFGSVPSEARQSVAAGLSAGTLKSTKEGFARSAIGRGAEVASAAFSGFSAVSTLGGLTAAGALTSAAGLASSTPDIASAIGSIQSLSSLAERDKALTDAGVLGALSKPTAKPKGAGDSVTTVASLRRPKPTASGDGQNLPKDPEVPTPRTTARARRPRTQTVFTGITGIA